jgi:hypothetical protein
MTLWIITEPSSRRLESGQGHILVGSRQFCTSIISCSTRVSQFFNFFLRRLIVIISDSRHPSNYYQRGIRWQYPYRRDRAFHSGLVPPRRAFRSPESQDKLRASPLHRTGHRYARSRQARAPNVTQPYVEVTTDRKATLSVLQVLGFSCHSPSIRFIQYSSDSLQ